MAGLTWLHLSDWHQKGPDFNRKVVRDGLIQDICERSSIDPLLERVDFAVFSGDLAFSGKREEYAAAQEYLLNPVLDAIGLKPEVGKKANRLLIVPGNHDLNRDSFEMLPPALQEPLSSEEQIQIWLDDDRRRTHLLEPLEMFRQFVSDYTGQSTPDYASILRLDDVDGKSVALLGLNSAWMCARNKNSHGEIYDYGYVLVGEPQIHEALKKIDDVDIRIAVMHHSFDWLAEFDRYRVRTRLRQKCHFILSGHEHCPDVEVMHGTLGNCIIIPAGASYKRRIAEHPRFTNAYNFVHLDFDNRRGLTYLRRWNDTRNRWTDDNESYPGGKYDFSLWAGF